MKTFKQFITEYDTVGTRRETARARFSELGIDEAWDPFIKWMFNGTFNPDDKTLDRAEHSFYAIRSVLPEEVLNTYGKLGTLYRGMGFDASELRKIYHGGLEIENRIMSWGPLHVADKYDEGGVVLKYKPRKSDVVLYMNKPTMEFLHVAPVLVVNELEAILSIPFDVITPNLVHTVPSYVRPRDQEDDND